MRHDSSGKFLLPYPLERWCTEVAMQVKAKFYYSYFLAQIVNKLIGDTSRS